MAHPTLPQLVHVPAEGPAAGTEVLPGRPAGGASQSAAEATLGLVTVDILGLAGTGVPPAPSYAIPPVVGAIGLYIVINQGSHSFTGLAVPGTATCLLVRAMAANRGGTRITITQVTANGVALASAGSPGDFWWAVTPLPTGAPAFVVTAASQAALLYAAVSYYSGAGPPGPIVRASGTGTRYSLTTSAVNGTRLVDAGIAEVQIGPVPPAPGVDSGQSPEYVRLDADYWQAFGSSRPIAGDQTATMGWTANPAYTTYHWWLAAITIPGA
jgi:hypothetical protein